MKRKSSLVIPCHWDWEVMQKILENPIPKNDIPVTEVYGVLGSGGPVGHGRAVSTVPFVEKKDAINFRRKLAERGIRFTYLINAPYDMETNSSERQKLDEYLSWIFNEMEPDAMMISSPDLIRYVRKNFSKMPIHISTIAGVKMGRDLEKFLDVQPCRVTVHHDLGKDWKRLEEVVAAGAKYGIQVQLLVTESCLLRCPNRERHYAYLAGQSRNAVDIPFMMTCNDQKLANPREFLLSGGAIRPEDLRIFEKMEIHYFKISGRDRDADWLPKVVTAYQRRSYEGNFLRLLDTAPSFHMEDLVSLDNKSLDGFLENFPSDDSKEAQAEYCDECIIQLWQVGKFSVFGKEYMVKNNSLILKE